MNWFNGNVAAAITASKISNSHLIVFLADNDALSQVYRESLNNLPGLENKAYVALRIEAQSLAHEQLMAVYGPIGIPSIVVINAQSGAALERLSGPSFDVEKLISLLPDKPVEMPTPEVIAVVSDVIVDTSAIHSSNASRANRDDSPLKSPLPKQEATVKQSPIASPSIAVAVAGISDEHSNARIQLKLHSGQSEVVVINARETLAVVRTQASQVFELRGPFDLAIPYPRRVFLQEEDLLSVETLGLCPASTLLVLPKAGTSEILTAQFTNGLFRYFEPILAFFRSIWERFTGRAREPVAPKTRIVRMKSD